MDNELEDVDSRALIVYRLGRVEKAVDTISEKLSVLEQMALNTARITSLEQWRSNVNKFIAAISVSVIATLLIQLFMLR